MSYSPTLGRFLERDPIGQPHIVESSPVIEQAVTSAAAQTAEAFGSTAADDEHLYQYADGMNLYQAFRGNPVQYADPSGLKVVVDGPFATYDNNGNPVYRYHYYNEGWFSTTFMYSKDYQRFEGNPNNTFDQALDCSCRGRGDFATAGNQAAQNAGGATGLGPTGEGLLMAGMIPIGFKAPHIMRHFKGTGITQEALEAAIRADLADELASQVSTSFRSTSADGTSFTDPTCCPTAQSTSAQRSRNKDDQMGNDSRPLSRQEEDVVRTMLASPFAGRNELIAQLDTATVTDVFNDGTIEFNVPANAPRAPVLMRVPVEAEVPDEDGVSILLLLHDVDGVLNELEIVKGDDSGVIRKPEASRLVIKVNK